MGMCYINPYHSTSDFGPYFFSCTKETPCPHCQDKENELPKPWANRHEKRKLKKMMKQGKLKDYKSVLEKDES